MSVNVPDSWKLQSCTGMDIYHHLQPSPQMSARPFKVPLQAPILTADTNAVDTDNHWHGRYSTAKNAW